MLFDLAQGSRNRGSRGGQGPPNLEKWGGPAPPHPNEAMHSDNELIHSQFHHLKSSTQTTRACLVPVATLPSCIMKCWLNKKLSDCSQPQCMRAKGSQGPDRLRSLCPGVKEGRTFCDVGGGGEGIDQGGPWPPQSFKGSYSTVAIDTL